MSVPFDILSLLLIHVKIKTGQKNLKKKIMHYNELKINDQLHHIFKNIKKFLCLKQLCYLNF